MRASSISTLLLNVCLVFLSYVYGDNQERACACTLESLWLDVVVVIDNSKGMTSQGVTQVLADVSTIFGQSNISQSLGQTTRVGIVTYGATANIAFRLTAFSSTEEMLMNIWLVQPSNDLKSDLKSGLALASNLLSEDRMNSERDNVKTAILVYASDYKEDSENDPVPLAHKIIESGISIITVAFNQDGNEGILAGLKSIASPGMAFDSTDSNLTGRLQGALCQVNCFCPNFWKQYGDSFENSTWKYGECLRLGEIDAMWIASKFACQNLHPGGYLASEFNYEKHLFNTLMIKSDKTASRPYMYHIGLSYDIHMGQYAWEQSYGLDSLPLMNGSYRGWNLGYPQLMGGNRCILSAQTGTNSRLGWQNENCFTVSKRYLCQIDSCDTDNYCTNI